nr:soluble scavenger receptor cysteine-rich domain-containing protein SSC5D-like [Penaeus vannamei]
MSRHNHQYLPPQESRHTTVPTRHPHVTPYHSTYKRPSCHAIPQYLQETLMSPHVPTRDPSCAILHSTYKRPSCHHVTPSTYKTPSCHAIPTVPYRYPHVTPYHIPTRDPHVTPYPTGTYSQRQDPHVTPYHSTYKTPSCHAIPQYLQDTLMSRHTTVPTQDPSCPPYTVLQDTLSGVTPIPQYLPRDPHVHAYHLCSPYKTPSCQPPLPCQYTVLRGPSCHAIATSTYKTPSCHVHTTVPTSTPSCHATDE